MNFRERVLQRWARKSGYEMVPLPRKSERLEIHLGLLFDLLDINCVLDVGANQGQYGRFLRQIGYAGRIISFEPVTADFNLLRIAADDDPNWFAHHFALGSEETTADINVTSDSLFNSFLKPNEFIMGQGLRILDTETVKVRPLDAVFGQLFSEKESLRLYLKLDTQGYDQEVLAGSQTVLNQVMALQTELSVKPVYENMPNYLNSLALLEKAGFEVTGLFPIARDNTLRVIEFDCVMVQTAIVGEATGVFPP